MPPSSTVALGETTPASPHLLGAGSAAIKPHESLPPARASAYPWHRDITTTLFWIGEPAGKGSPTNASSSWDERWQTHFGGVDDPHRRLGYRPADFRPKLNPFYIALPYNDLRNGKRRPDAAHVVPWAASRAWGPAESMCKGRWLRIVRGQRVAYAQWDDVGPFVTDDASYVFGQSRPRNTSNHASGLDVSPAVRDCLGLRGIDTVDWQFVDEADVPDGPWKAWR
ncbi:MAG: hypothetical protein NTW19_25155 [Planctomycetota bacterium]|nr:hypothetical protein [Planctomycetota bacterium]